MLRASKNLISIFMRTIFFLYCSTILIFSMFVSHVYNQISVLLCHLCIFYFCKIVCNVHAYIHILIRQLWENYGNWASGEIWAFFCKNIQQILKTLFYKIFVSHYVIYKFLNFVTAFPHSLEGPMFLMNVEPDGRVGSKDFLCIFI